MLPYRQVRSAVREDEERHVIDGLTCPALSFVYLLGVHGVLGNVLIMQGTLFIVIHIAATMTVGRHDQAVLYLPRCGGPIYLMHKSNIQRLQDRAH